MRFQQYTGTLCKYAVNRLHENISRDCFLATDKNSDNYQQQGILRECYCTHGWQNNKRLQNFVTTAIMKTRHVISNVICMHMKLSAALEIHRAAVHGYGMLDTFFAHEAIY